MSGFFLYLKSKGGLAHLARALRWQRRGDRFESGILHYYFKIFKTTDSNKAKS